MKQEDFELEAKDAAKAMLKKKAPTRPETQFVKGAMWAWELLTQGRTVAEYEEQLRRDVCARFNTEEPEQWQVYSLPLAPPRKPPFFGQQRFSFLLLNYPSRLSISIVWMAPIISHS